METLNIQPDTNIKTLHLAHIVHTNSTGTPFPVITNRGNIDKMYMFDVDGDGDTLLNNLGTIGYLKHFE